MRPSLSICSICSLHGIRTGEKVSTKTDIPMLTQRLLEAKVQALLFLGSSIQQPAERKGVSWYSHHCSCREGLLSERGGTPEMEEKTDPSLGQQEKGQVRINFE